jgi:hypothetical protein
MRRLVLALAAGAAQADDKKETVSVPSSLWGEV